MTLRLESERAEIAQYAKRLRPDRLVAGTSGNLSWRVGDLLVVTPSGVDYDACTPELICVCDLDGNQLEGELEATSEMPLHLSVYRHTDHQAVVHTHATAATAVSTFSTELPAFHYLIALFGGPVRVAPYATYGTPELAESVTEALEGRTGCLMANHGTVTVGPTLAKAYELNLYLEWLCDVWLRASTGAASSPSGIRPVQLSEAEIAKVRKKMESYGQEPPR